MNIQNNNNGDYMKRILFLCLLFLLQTAANSQTFYYAYNEKIPLKKSENRLSVKIDPLKTNIHDWLKDKKLSDGAKEVKSIGKENYVIEFSSIDELNKAKNTIGNQDVAFIEPVYLSERNYEMPVSDEICAEFLPHISDKEKKKILSQLGLKIKKQNKHFDVLQITGKSGVLNAANLLQETGCVKYSHPNFLVFASANSVIPNDAYFGLQFALNNTGQIINDGRSGSVDADIDAPEAWDITKGSSQIVIAVIDEGVTGDHPDLPNSRQIRLNGSNFSPNENPDDPSPTNVLGDNNHGNACAGLIAATQDNGEGITGVAPNCKILPVKVKFGEGGSTPDALAAAIDFACDNGADVISNSWGYFDGITYTYFPVIVEAISNATTQGRNGKGCVMVFAAGNTARHYTPDCVQIAQNSNTEFAVPSDDDPVCPQPTDGYVMFPANVNIPGVITVGASDRSDIQADYSPTSTLLDVVAPSHRSYKQYIETEDLEVWTMDVPGQYGYNPREGEYLPASGTNYQSYTGRFGGTSAACPLVAGTAALILSLNPNLTQLEVFDIVTNNTDRIGGETYDPVTQKNDKYGYGRLNAFKCVSSIRPENLSINGPIVVGNGVKKTYEAVVSITVPIASTFECQSGSNVSFACSSSIQFKPGFSARNGSIMRANITNWSNSSSATIIAQNMSPSVANADPIEKPEAQPIIAEKTLEVSIPTEFSLSQNYPNPFNPTTTMRYALKEDVAVTLKIYNMLGQEVKTLVNNQKQAAGFKSVMWDGRNNYGHQVPSGTYIYRLQAGTFIQTRKMLLVK